MSGEWQLSSSSDSRALDVVDGARPGTVMDEGKPVEVRGGAAKTRGPKVFTVDEDGGETLIDLDAKEAAPADDSDDLAF